MFSRIFRRRVDRSVPRTFEGDVIYADTGSPVAGARLTIDAIEGEHGGNIKETTGQADHVGHFKLTPHLGKWFWIRAYPLAGEPYLPFGKRISLAKDDPTPRIQLSLPRGIMVCGKIVEAKSGNPVSSASVQYESGSRLPEGIVTGWIASVLSDADGAFQIAVPSGQGALFVYGPLKFSSYPSNIYSYQTVETREFSKAVHRGKRHYVHAWVPLDVNTESEPALPTITVRRSVPIRGRLVGPSGLPIDRALMLSRLCVGTDTTGFRCFPVAIIDGQFQLHGLDCHERTLVYFLEPRKQLGAVVEIAGTSKRGEPLVIQLKKCGRAIARFVDPEGKPLVKFRPLLQIVVAPGPGNYGDFERRKNELMSDEDFVANMDRKHYWPGPLTDRHGRCTFPALIPGATYRLPILRTSGERDELDFTVQAGQTLQLPDIALKLD